MFLETFCESTKDIWIFIGQLVFIFKIVIPVILVIIGIVTFGKAVIADDDKEIKTAVTKLIKKIIVAVIIFFLPNIIKAVFGLVGGGYNDGDHADYINCINYVVDRK